ncbi:type IV secretory system conjugative DNA transfer family protein [Bordetella sp. 15P40C-2]|uniref:type IV secretory system conjugative DNA transfer family protein n=1 Tax=Bordetella sp. 15P40C-2 TaxID=2572246 RepID=UPI001320B316|nr:type IV secretion system DNA-binding domain-containing protein [Bordetella sp. 15P40C-2]MVW72880.1 type IV secretion system DNA-binding domain-containing protein [Bordetella sp. 15P40C-2]
MEAESIKFFGIITFVPLLVFYICIAGVRPFVHWLLKTGLLEPIAFFGRWLFWLCRKTWKAVGRWLFHLVTPKKRIWPELGAADPVGSVRESTAWRGMRVGGAADTWIITASIFACALRFTPLRFFIYPGIFFESEFLIYLINFLEALFIVGPLGWFAYRFLISRRPKNAIKSPVTIISSNGLNQKAEFCLGKRIDTGQRIYLPAKLLRYNLLGYGAPGSGKTSLAKLLMKQQIDRGGGLIFIDAKLDSSDVRDVFYFAKSAGREKDILFINPGNPTESNTYNPIIFGDEDEIADRCLALLPVAQTAAEDYYREAARRVIKSTIAALRQLGLAFNFRDLSTIIGSSEAMASFAKDLNKKSPFSAATADFLFLLGQFRASNGQYDVRRLQELFGGIAGRLATFGTGKFGEVTSAYSPEVNLFKAIKQQKIIYVSLPSMGKAEASMNFAKIFIADLRTALSWLQAQPENERKLFFAFLDEAASYSMPAMETMFAQNRSSGVSLIPLTQTPAQFANVSPEFVDIVETGCKTKVFFKLADAAACERAATLVGNVARAARSVAEDRSSGTNTNKASASPDGADAGGKSQRFAENEEDDWRVRPEDFARLSVGEGIIWTEGRELVHFLSDLPPSAPPEVNVNVYREPPQTVEGVRFYEKFVLPQGQKKAPANAQDSSEFVEKTNEGLTSEDKRALKEKFGDLFPEG